MRVIRGLDELLTATGEDLGVSEWHTVSQQEIDAFAAATGDDYWIHTDPDRAAGTPLGSTIAHGLYTLALGPMFTYSLVAFEGFVMSLNYGYDKVRFPAPVPVDSRVRMRCQLAEVQTSENSARVSLLQTFEREGGEKPVCVATHVVALLTKERSQRADMLQPGGNSK
jgi:acyl dehydratase